MHFDALERFSWCKLIKELWHDGVLLHAAVLAQNIRADHKAGVLAIPALCFTRQSGTLCFTRQTLVQSANRSHGWYFLVKP